MHTRRYKYGQYQGGILKKVNAKGSIISNTFYTRQHQSEWHSHENAHLALLFYPSKAETKNKERYSDYKGNIFTYHEGQIHRFTTRKGITTSSNIEIGKSFLNKYNFTFSTFEQNLLKKENAKSLIIQTQAELFGDDFNKELNILSLLLEMASSEPKEYFKQPVWIDRLKNLLQDNWNETLTLDYMSMEIGVHPVTISKYFRKYVGCTIGQYRRKIRIERSLSIIKSTKMSLSEVAHYCNYSDQSHFIREFRKHIGLKPFDFKKM